MVSSPLIYSLNHQQMLTMVEAGTPRECLSKLVKRFPSLEPALLTEDGEPRHGVYVFLNKNLLQADQMDEPLESGDEIGILTLIDGG